MAAENRSEDGSTRTGGAIQIRLESNYFQGSSGNAGSWQLLFIDGKVVHTREVTLISPLLREKHCLRVQRGIFRNHDIPWATRSAISKRMENTMQRKASAVWNGGLKEGKGTISTESGVLSNTAYSFSTRFENEKGTNPEELIGAAHAGCFSMALSAQLGEAGINPEKIETEATVTIEKVPDGFSVTTVHLNVRARIPGADETAFQEAARKAKEGCPISKLLNAKITMDAQLIGA